MDEDIEGQDVARQQVVEAAQQLLANALDHYKAALRGSRKARAYLRSRGISREIAAKFSVGYARADWQGLGAVLQGHSEAVIEASGLVARREDGRGYDRFRDRIMFPIRDASGFVVGFGGRSLEGVSEVKYLNSPESEVFRKRESLFGLWEARQAIEASGQSIVVEGYFDVLAPVQAGIENVVATLGTAFTAEHVKALLAVAREVVFCFDGDAAGRRAAARALEAVLPCASDATIKFAFLPQDQDPDSLVRAQGAQGLRAVVAQALSLEAYLREYAAEGCNLDHLEGRVKAAARAGGLWRMLPEDSTVGSGILLDCAQRFEIPVDSLLANWRRSAGS